MKRLKPKVDISYDTKRRFLVYQVDRLGNILEAILFNDNLTDDQAFELTSELAEELYVLELMLLN